MLAVLWPACGDDASLRQEIERLGSNRARALKLFLHNKPADGHSVAFSRAEALFDCGAKRPGGRSWKMYRLKRLSRDWTPKQYLPRRIQNIVEGELSRQNEPHREVKVEAFSRPSHPSAGGEDLCHTIIINIAASTETEEVWQGKSLTNQPKVPNRKIVICITPIAKGFDCGWNEVNAAMASDVMRAVASKVLGQKDDPEPIEPVSVRLSGLSDRPRFWGRAPEHKIQSVQVKKLVVSAGSGTRTYFAPAKSKADAYDVAPRSLPGARIIAASIRVCFSAGAFGQKQKFVNFDLGLPNRCNLRETEDAENYILKHCLEAWGLIEPETDDDRPLSISTGSRELSHLLGLDQSGLTRREAEACFGAHLESLIELGALEEHGPGDTTICELCCEPHPADMQRTGSGWMVHCPAAGTALVAFDALPFYAPNFDALAIGLAATLPLEHKALRRLPPDPIVYLGSGPGKHDWSALFAPRFSSPQDMDRVCDCLRKNASLAPGILICSADAPKHVPLPGKHVAVSIDELFALQGGRLQHDDRRLAHALNRKTPPKRSGRPSVKKEALAIAAVRRKMGVQAATPESELSAIKFMLHSSLGDVELPTDKVMRYDWLQEHFAELQFPKTRN